MSPTKFARQAMTPNKPPVCHKGPITPIPPGTLPFDRPGTLFLQWRATPAAGDRYRSWAQATYQMIGFRGHRAQGVSGLVQFDLWLSMSPDAKTFTINLFLWDNHGGLLVGHAPTTPLIDRHGWTTGLLQFQSNFDTRSCQMEVMA